MQLWDRPSDGTYFYWWSHPASHHNGSISRDPVPVWQRTKGMDGSGSNSQRGCHGSCLPQRQHIQPSGAGVAVPSRWHTIYDDDAGMSLNMIVEIKCRSVTHLTITTLFSDSKQCRLCGKVYPHSRMLKQNLLIVRVFCLTIVFSGQVCYPRVCRPKGHNSHESRWEELMYIIIGSHRSSWLYFDGGDSAILHEVEV